MLLPVILELATVIMEKKGDIAEQGVALLKRLFLCSAIFRREIFGRISSHIMMLTALSNAQGGSRSVSFGQHVKRERQS